MLECEDGNPMEMGVDGDALDAGEDESKCILLRIQKSLCWMEFPGEARSVYGHQQ